MSNKKEIRCLKLIMSKDKYLVIRNAIDKMKSKCLEEHGQEISDSRALEFIITEHQNGR